MAKKKNKKKPATSGAKEQVLSDVLLSNIKAGTQKELKKLLHQANKYEAFKQLYSSKQSGKSYHASKFLETYGKAGQMGAYTGENAEQHKWLTWMRHQMLKLHPGVTKTEIFKEAPWDQVRFGVYISALGQTYKFSQAVSMELMISAIDLEGLGHAVLKDLKAQIDKAFPQATAKPGNMTLVQSEFMDPNKMFLVPPDLHNSFEQYAASLKETKFKELATIWLEKHPAPIKPIPTPPEKDKEYDLSPVEVYNNALKKIESYAKAVNNKYVWGEIKQDIEKHFAKQQALAKIKQSHGFNGSRVQDSLQKVLPCLYEQVKCPVCGATDAMSSMIIHLNDGEMWSREQIADWAESLDIDISVKETK